MTGGSGGDKKNAGAACAAGWGFNAYWVLFSPANLRGLSLATQVCMYLQAIWKEGKTLSRSCSLGTCWFSGGETAPQRTGLLTGQEELTHT